LTGLASVGTVGEKSRFGGAEAVAGSAAAATPATVAASSVSVLDMFTPFVKSPAHCRKLTLKV
jgi:hypothetical protein